MLLWECADIEASLPWYPVILLGKGMCQEAFTRKGYISIPTTHIFKKKKSQVFTTNSSSLGNVLERMRNA